MRENRWLPAARNVVVYFSYDDLALRASKGANASLRSVSRRLGHTGPYDMTKVPANVYAIDCDKVAMRYDPGATDTRTSCTTATRTREGL
jgi:hypothetical protein